MASDVEALKPYLEKVRELCRSHTHEKLIEVIARVAAEQPADARAGFALQMARVLEGSASDPDLEEEAQTLLRDVQEFQDAFFERQADLDDDWFLDDDRWRLGYGDNEFGEDKPEPLSEREEEKALKELFHRIGRVFVNGQFGVAAQAYAVLLECIKYEEERFDSLHLFEVKARYFRSVLESAPRNRRAQELAKRMIPGGIGMSWPQAMEAPCLQDIIEAAEQPIRNLDSFFKEWKRVLQTKRDPYATWLLLEAVEWNDGVEGLKQLALRNQGGDPLVFVRWIEANERLRNFEGMKEAALLALERVSPDTAEKQRGFDSPVPDIRAWFIESLIDAAGELGDDEALLMARREQALEKLTGDAVSALLHDAERAGRFDAELDRLNELLARRRGPPWLRMKTALLRGDWDQAKQLAASQEKVTAGWVDDDDCIGLYMAGLMACLCGARVDKVPAVNALLQRYAEAQPVDHEQGVVPNAFRFAKKETPEKPDGSSRYFTGKILESLQQHPLPPDRWGECYRKAEALAERWLNIILEGHRRRSYDRAAEMLAALAETLAVNGDRQGADALIHQYTKVRYSRLSGFRKAMERFHRCIQSR